MIASGFDRRQASQIELTNVEKIMRYPIQSPINVGDEEQNVNHAQFFEYH